MSAISGTSEPCFVETCLPFYKNWVSETTQPWGGGVLYEALLEAKRGAVCPVWRPVDG